MILAHPFSFSTKNFIYITMAMIRYGIVLMHPGQPLLLLKQSHNAHNLLVNFNDEGLFLCLNDRFLILSPF